jgi:TonB-dependent receptor
MRQKLLFAALLLTTATGAFAADADPAPGDDQIIVTARRAANTAREEQKLAPNLINIQAAEDIVKYPDFNAAEALGRIPGVSLAIDTGEGRFVAIRGLDSNFNGTTFGGVTLLNTQPGGTYFGGGGRATELDTIPIGSVDRIIVRKTGLPDQEAEGLGGSVELSPRTSVGIKKPFLEASFGGGYEAFRNNWDVFNGEGAVGSTFGPDKTLAIVLSGSYHTDRRGFDDLEPGPLDSGFLPDGVTPDPKFTNPQLDTVDLRRYTYNRRRFGFGGELDWTPNAQSHYYIRANDTGYTEAVNTRLILQYRGLSDSSIVNPANPNGYLSSGVSARVSLRDEQETAINFVTAAGGRNDLGPVIVDYQLSYTSATYHRDYDYFSQFRQTNGTFNAAYDNKTNVDILKLTPIGFNPNDPTQFKLRSIGNTTERAFDREYAGALNLTVPTTLLGGDGEFKFGGKLRFRDKTDSQLRYSTGTLGTTTLLSDVLGGGPYTNFYDNRFSVGYSPNKSGIRAIYNAANPAGALNVGGYFSDTENIYAGYGQYNGKFGKLNVLVGLRIENTDTTLRGLSVADGGAPAPVSSKSNYTNFFPTVQLTYNVSDNLLGRATYSTGIGRPGFLQTISGSSVDNAAFTISTGNPGLKPITANNFDLSLEYYLPKAGILSIGFFDKEINNYILQRVTRIPNFNGTGNIYTSSTYSNVDGAYVRGIEGNYVQKFTELPGFLDGFGFSGNITYVKSKVQIRDAFTNSSNAGFPLPGSFAALPGTSQFTYNIAGFYEAHKIQARLSLLHVDSTIFVVGPSDGRDVFEDARTTLDLTTSYQLRPQLAVYFNAKNLLDTPLRYYEGYNNKTIQREFYGITYEAGVRLTF